MKNNLSDAQECSAENSRTIVDRLKSFLSNHLVAVISSFILMVVSLVAFFWCFYGCDLSLFDYLQNIFISVAGALGCVYIYHSVKIFWWRPIKRDWILSQGRYVGRVVLFVLSVPVALTFLIGIINNGFILRGCRAFDHSQMMYVEEMYGGGINGGKESGGTDSNSEEVSLCEKCGAEEHSPSLLWIVFYHFIDPGNQHTTLSLLGRILAGICAVFGVVLLNGLLVSVLVGWFDSKRVQWSNGEARYTKYLRKRRHYVIIGGGDIDVYIIKSIFDNIQPDAKGRVKYPYVVVQTTSSVEKLRSDIYSLLDDDSQQRHVVIYRGDRTSRNDVRDLCIESAMDIYLIGDVKNQESAEIMHDTFNMRCLEYVAEFAINKPKVYVMFECQTTFSVYQFSDISDEIKSKIDFKPVNFYEMWAQRLFVQPSIKNLAENNYIPLEGKDGINAQSEEFVHLVIVGMSRMGVALGIEAAHLAHYPNFVTNGKRTRITFIDPNMAQERDYFMGRFKAMFELARYRYLDCSTVRDEQAVKSVLAEEWIDPTISGEEQKYSHLGENFIDVEWEFINGSIESPAIQQYLIDSSSVETKSKLTIAMCQDEPNVAVASAIYLPRTVFLSNNLLQVLVYQRYDDSLFAKLSDKPYKTPFQGKLKTFGVISRGFDVDSLECCQTISGFVGDAYNISMGYETENASMVEYFASHKEFIAETANAFRHPAAKAADGLLAEQGIEKLKDISVSYGKTPAAKHWSSIYSANALWIRRRCMGDVSDADVEKLMLLSEVEHNRWNVEQLLMSYAPLSVEEQDVFLYSESLKAELKRSGKELSNDEPTERYKYMVKDIYKTMMKHPNICSFERLKAIDNESIMNDTYIVFAADYIYSKLN